MAAGQSLPGQGNDAAARLAGASPMVQSAMTASLNHVHDIRSGRLRAATLDAIGNRSTCIAHRAGVTAATQTVILTALTSEGLIAAADAASFPGGALEG
jgi:hypothetical protein